MVLAFATVAIAEDRGTCPMAPPPVDGRSFKKSTAPTNAGLSKVSVLVVVSDAGYVCSARVVKGIDKDTDRKAREIVSKWRFKPGMKDGKPVSAAVLVELTYRRDANGNLVSDTPHLIRINPSV